MEGNGEEDDFVQNVSGDECDEFEKKLEESYQQRIGSAGSRPESSKRLMSGKTRPSDLKPINNHQSITNLQTHPIEEEKVDADYSHSRQISGHLQEHEKKELFDIYSRFSKFVRDNKLERDDFCRPIHFVLPMDEFQECFKTVGFSISNDDIYQIFKDHNAHKSGYLPMEEFYGKLLCWRDYQQKKDAEINDIRDQANKLIEKQDPKKGQSQGGSKKRPITAVVAGAKNLRNLPTQQNQKSRLDSANRQSSTVGMLKSTNQSKSQFGNALGTSNVDYKTPQYYLKVAKQKQMEEERALELTIDKSKRETEFDCLHKMGEACEIAKILNLPILFTASKDPNTGALKIVYSQFMEETSRRKDDDDDDDDDDEDEGVKGESKRKEVRREISMKEFFREYRKLKRMQNSVKNNYMMSTNQGGTQGQGGQSKPPNISQNTIVSSYSLNRINKKDRQQELKEVLQETMKLTRKLKDQLKILERNGVCGTQPNKASPAFKPQSPKLM